MNVKTLKKERVYNGVVFDIYRDECEYIISGNTTIREVVEHHGGSVIVPVLDDGRIIFIKQFRYPIQKEIFELPAGKLFPNEDPFLCAQRELEEETGYIANEWKHLTSMYTSPGFCSELLHIYLATKLTPATDGRKLEEGELGMELHLLSMSEAMQKIADKEIIDGKTIAGIMLASMFFKYDCK
ncbi:MAG: NUDIX hydrolase [Bacteroidota bacterium]